LNPDGYTFCYICDAVSVEKAGKICQKCRKIHFEEEPTDPYGININQLEFKTRKG